MSPTELVKLYLERIQRLVSQLGNYFTVMAEQATRDAKAKTEMLERVDSSELPPFLVCQL